MVVGIVEEELGGLEEDPDFGQIICRCETVTKAEIIQAIREPVGARTVNGVKRRVRPGSGRCPGGFCQPRVVNILAEELGIPETEVRLERDGSEILCDDIKEPLMERGDKNE